MSVNTIESQTIVLRSNISKSKRSKRSSKKIVNFPFEPNKPEELMLNSDENSLTINFQSAPNNPRALLLNSNGIPLPIFTVPGCPYGLEYLFGTHDLIVQRQVEDDEILSNTLFGLGFECTKKYDIFNSWEQRIYFAVEDNICLGSSITRMTGTTQPFKVVVLDYTGRPVLIIERSLNTKSCLTYCRSYCENTAVRLTVCIGDGSYFGEVIQEPNGTQPLFFVIDYKSNLVVKILGSQGSDCCCCCSCCARPCTCGKVQQFTLFMPDGTKAGSITKHWGGLAMHGYSDAASFAVSFPFDFDYNSKALILGAVFLIDLMFLNQEPPIKKSFHNQPDIDS